MATATITRVEELQSFKHDLSKKNVKIDAEFQEGLRLAQRLLELSEQGHSGRARRESSVRQSLDQWKEPSAQRDAKGGF